MQGDRESILRLGRPSEVAAHKYPISEIVSLCKIYSKGFGLQEDEVGNNAPTMED